LVSFLKTKSTNQYIQKVLTVTWRQLLSKAIHRIYFSDIHYYQLNVLDKYIDNPYVEKLIYNWLVVTVPVTYRWNFKWSANDTRCGQILCNILWSFTQADDFSFCHRILLLSSLCQVWINSSFWAMILEFKNWNSSLAMGFIFKDLDGKVPSDVLDFLS